MQEYYSKLNKNLSLYYLFPEEIKSNYEIIHVLLTKNKFLFFYVPVNVMQPFLFHTLSCLDFPFDLSNEKMTDNITSFFSNLSESRLDLVIRVLKEKPFLFLFFLDYIKDNFEICLEAMKIDGLFYHYISKRLQSNEEMVWEAILENNSIISMAPEKMKRNEIIMHLAVEKNISNFRYMSHQIKTRDFLFFLLQKRPNIYSMLDERYRMDEDFIRVAIKNAYNIYYIPECLTNNPRFINRLLKINHDVFPFLVDRMKEHIQNQRKLNLLYQSQKMMSDDIYILIEEFLYRF